MKAELEIMSDIVNPKGVVVKKDIISKRVFDLDRVEVEQFMSNRGTIVKKYCTILSNGTVYKCNKSYEYIRNLILPITVTGFQAKSRCK